MTRQSNENDPGRHRGHNIYRVGASFKAIGQVFDTRAAAMAAIDQKLDPLPALEQAESEEETGAIEAPDLSSSGAPLSQEAIVRTHAELETAKKMNRLPPMYRFSRK